MPARTSKAKRIDRHLDNKYLSIPYISQYLAYLSYVWGHLARERVPRLRQVGRYLQARGAQARVGRGGIQAGAPVLVARGGVEVSGWEARQRVHPAPVAVSGGLPKTCTVCTLCFSRTHPLYCYIVVFFVGGRTRCGTSVVVWVCIAKLENRKSDTSARQVLFAK